MSPILRRSAAEPLPATFALVLLLHVAAFSAAAQGTSLELIEALPDTGTLYPGDVFFAQFKVRVINPPQFGGVKILVESVRGGFHCQRNAGRGPRFHLKSRE